MGNEKRLIDARCAQHIANVELSPDDAGVVQWVLSHTPTVDAVEVVRCKDCKYHEDEEIGMVYCPNMIGGWVVENWFCADGERKEGAD